VQWELVYVNHIEQGPQWQTVGDGSELFPGLLGRPSSAGVGEPESVEGHWAYRFREPDARLHVRMDRVQRLDNPGIKVLRLELIARGPMSGNNDLSSDFEVGHRMIVESFFKLASAKVLDRWGPQA
jgi:hypothetical protein